MFLIFLKWFKISSVGLKLIWLLFLKQNRPRSENSNVVAGLPVPMGYDCAYYSAYDSSSPFILSDAGSSSNSCGI